MVRGFKKRFRKAYRKLEDAMEDSGDGRLTRSRIGHMIEDRLGKGRSPNAVSEWWTGKSIPDTPAMAALADVLGVDPGWLEFGPEFSLAPRKAMTAGSKEAVADIRAAGTAFDEAKEAPA